MERDDEIEKISRELESILEKEQAGNKISQPSFDGFPEDRAGMRENHTEGLKALETGEPVMFSEDRTEEKPHQETEEELSPFPENHGFEEDWEEELSKPGLLRPYDGLLAAFLVPVIIMIIIFIQRGIFPFGDESFLRTDMYHQYAPFFSEFQDKLTGGGSLLYSWNVGMGVNFAALYAYYLASPLNWLIVFCPKAYIIEFMTYMIVLKIGLSGLSFAWYLRKSCKTNDFGAAFFGIFYALSGYMAAYSWNIMWLDCLLLFPLIVLGLERLVREKKCFLYCITLGLSILSNYYISIMICIFMVLYFMALLILEKKEKASWYGGAAARFTVFSLAAGGLAAVVLLPEICVLQSTASGNVNFPQTFSSYFSIFDMIGRHLPNVETETGLDHWPNIYCGVAVLMFFLLYLMSSRIRKKEKAVYCGLLLLFFASFSINVLNFIWHGFHYPNSLPCRQSFIYIFLVLTVCYKAYMDLKITSWRRVSASFGAAVVFVFLAQKLITDSAYHFSVFYVAILYLAGYLWLIWLYQKGKSRSLLVLCALALVSVEAAVNTTVTSVTTTSRISYTADNQASRSLAQSVMGEGDLFRFEKVTRKTKNDGAWLNIPTVSLFSSTANADLTDFFRRLGCESSTNAYSITGSTPFVDSLFSVKYGLYSTEAADTGLLSLVDAKDGMWLYENSYTLPVGVVIPYDLEGNWQTDLSNPADVQNDFAAVMGTDSLLEEVPSETLAATLDFTVSQPGDYYVYISNKKVEQVTVYVGEDSIKSFDNVNRGYFLELGYLEAGTEVSLQNDDGSEEMFGSVYRFSPEGLRQIYEILNRNSAQMTKVRDTFLQGTIDSDRAGLLYFSIPYDEGWTIVVDGQEEEPYKIFDTFLSVHLSAGTHEIQLKYIPQGLKAGAVITGISAAFLVILAGVNQAGKKKSIQRKYMTEQEQDTEDYQLEER